MSLELRKFIVQAQYLERDPETGRPLREVLAYGNPQFGPTPREFLDLQALQEYLDGWPDELARVSAENDESLRAARNGAGEHPTGDEIENAVRPQG